MIKDDFVLSLQKVKNLTERNQYSQVGSRILGRLVSQAHIDGVNKCFL